MSHLVETTDRNNDFLLRQTKEACPFSLSCSFSLQQVDIDGLQALDDMVVHLVVILMNLCRKFSFHPFTFFFSLQYNLYLSTFFYIPSFNFFYHPFFSHHTISLSFLFKTEFFIIIFISCLPSNRTSFCYRYPL